MQVRIDDHFADLNSSIKDRPIGQRRTRRNGQFVILGKTRVWKGPFTNEQARLIEYRSQWLRYWKIPLVVLPEKFITLSEGIFIVYPNLDDMSQIQTELYQESFSDLQYHVLIRDRLQKLNYALPKEDWIYDHGRDLVLALVSLWILGVGDTCMANILVNIDKKTVHIIDYDMNSGSVKDNTTFYFSSPPGRIYDWYNNVKMHYIDVAERLNVILQDIRKISESVDGFTENYTSLPESIRDCHAENHTNDLLFFDRIQKAQTLLLRYGQIDFSFDSTGKMKWGGIFGDTVTYSGYPLDEMKSAMQKYIRRGMVEKALQSVVELWRLAELGGTAAQTNMYNRLAIISVEDVGPASIDIVLYTVNYVFNGVHQNIDRSLEYLCAITQQLCVARKTRVMSHLWYAYGTPEGRAQANKLGFQVTENITLNGDRSIDRFFEPSDPNDLVLYATLFYRRLQERNFLAIYWLSEYMRIGKDAKVKARRRRTKSIIIIWEMLRDFLPDTAVDILSKGYFSTTESRTYLMTAVVWILYIPDPKFTNLTAKIESTATLWRNSSMMKSLMFGDYTLELDDYVIDKHTRRGCQNGKNIHDFVTEGAHVENEAMEFSGDALRYIYTCRS